MLPTQFAGSIKYEGLLVAEGLIEARSAARALHGIDTTLRYFVAIEDPTLGAIDFPIPVQTRKGSWEALVAHAIDHWVATSIKIVGTTYLTAVAKQLATNGFKDETISSVLKKALLALQEFIRVGKHLGHLSIERITSLKWDKEGMVGLLNNHGNVLYISHEHWKKFSQCPPNILSDLASVVEPERTLIVSVRVNRQIVQTSISAADRHIFYYDEKEPTEIIFPDLAHGAPVHLNGLVTRENGRSKTLGFHYQDHILTCMPASGEILPYKKHLYLPCRMHGIVTRTNPDTGEPTEKKPKIVFTDLEILSDKEQLLPGFTATDDE